MRFDELVKDVVAQLLDVDEPGLAMDRDLATLESWDSVNALRILVYLEREIGAALDYDRFMSAQCLADISLIAEEAVHARNAADNHAANNVAS